MTEEPTPEGFEMDPISASLAAVGTAGKAIAAVEGNGSDGTKWLERMLGPAADELGEALRRWTSFRVGNTQRITDAASRKAKDRVGVLPQRVVYQVLDDGSLVDDELGAEYFGGLLAASVTPGGRDDRAVAWTKLLTQMSAIEIRAHYLLYQQWWALLAEKDGGPLSLGLLSDEAMLFVDTVELCERLVEVSGEPDEQAAYLVYHAISALARHQLIESTSMGWGPREQYAEQGWHGYDLPFEHAVCATPSLAGIELWGYAHGQSSLTNSNFAATAAESDYENAVPPLQNVALAKTVRKPRPPREKRPGSRNLTRRPIGASDERSPEGQG